MQRVVRCLSGCFDPNSGPGFPQGRLGPLDTRLAPRSSTGSSDEPVRSQACSSAQPPMRSPRILSGEMDPSPARLWQPTCSPKKEKSGPPRRQVRAQRRRCEELLRQGGVALRGDLNQPAHRRVIKFPTKGAKVTAISIPRICARFAVHVDCAPSLERRGRRAQLVRRTRRGSPPNYYVAADGFLPDCRWGAPQCFRGRGNSRSLLSQTL